MKPSRLLMFSLLFSAASLVSLAAPSEADKQIKQTAEMTYNFRTVLQDQVKVEVENGVVDLTGTVPEESLKTLAENTVRSISGVSDVHNHIAVEPPPPEHSDAWIALKVRTTLLVRANVSFAETTVEVKDGVVTLAGTAESVAQKELTESYARDVEGVKSIVNRMIVREMPADKKRTMGEVVDDASITARVKYELLTHRSTSALATNITTKDGVVTIVGEAKNEAEKTLVTRLAKAVKGVQSVVNEMTIKPQP